MKGLKNLLNDQKGMTGLETAIILIAFVTVAAVFGYAVLSAGLFSAERGKETIYAGLNEARSNLELSGSVMAKSDDSVNVRSVLFTVKNAIAGNPIDMTANDGSGKNKCVISLTTGSDYINNVKWSKVAIGANNGNNLLETGEQFEITVDLTDLGSAGSLSENLTAYEKFSLQVKPAMGSTITIQRQLPPAIGPIMDLDMLTSFGGGTNGTGGSPGGTPSLICTNVRGFADPNQVVELVITFQNNGTAPAHISPSAVTLAVDGGAASVITWTVNMGSTNPFAVGQTCRIFTTTPLTLQVGQTFTITVTPDGGSALSIIRTIPGGLSFGLNELP
jgi:flagellin FlaB